jgi:hypothetical protein
MSGTSLFRSRSKRKFLVPVPSRSKKNFGPGSDQKKNFGPGPSRGPGQKNFSRGPGPKRIWSRSRSKKNFGPGPGSEPLCPSLMRIMIYFNINMLFFSSISTFLSYEIHLIFVFFSTINETSVLLQMLRYAAASLNDFSECFRRIFITHELWQYDIQHKSYTSVKIIIPNKKVLVPVPVPVKKKILVPVPFRSKKNFWSRDRDRDRDHFAHL